MDLNFDLLLPFDVSRIDLNLYILLPVLGFLGGLLLYFFVLYVLPGNRIEKNLKEISKLIGRLSSKDLDNASYSDVTWQIEKIIEESPISSYLAHLWSEYRETLHSTKDQAGNVVEIRATASAGDFFTKHSIVDINIQADFFKHLPGILTGIGIIATFTGLLIGLFEFQTDPTDQTNLYKLIREVTSAFVGSGVAIFVAILVTWFEKGILRRCYANLELFVQSIDELFQEGVGEEYLSRLVHAAEKNSADTAALKDSLVTDLKALMHEVADKQIVAVTEQNNRMANTIGDAIERSLERPMNKIADVVETASGQQGDAVSGLLKDLMSAFIERLDRTFGDQIESINTQLKTSADVMNKVQQGLDKLIGDISSAGDHAVNQMSSKLTEAMTQAADAQQQMNENQREFVKELKELVKDQQTDTKVALEKILEDLAMEFKARQDDASREREKEAAESADRMKDISKGAQDAYAGLTKNVQSLVNNITDVMMRMEENIQSIQSVSIDAISGLGDGAAQIKESSKHFWEAGESVKDIFAQSESLVGRLDKLSNSMELGAESLSDVVSNHRKIKGEVASLLEDVKAVISEFSEEAGDRTAVITQMKGLVASIAELEEQSKKTIEEIESTLGVGFETFGNAMVTTIENLASASDKHFMSTMTAFGESVVHLSDQLQDMSDQVRQTKED